MHQLHAVVNHILAVGYCNNIVCKGTSTTVDQLRADVDHLLRKTAPQASAGARTADFGSYPCCKPGRICASRKPCNLAPCMNSFIVCGAHMGAIKSSGFMGDDIHSSRMSTAGDLAVCLLYDENTPQSCSMSNLVHRFMCWYCALCL